MATVRDLIKGSLRLIGAIATGETPSADEQTDALSSLNRMIDSWSNEGLLIHAKVREEFSLTPSQSSYTMGVGGDFNTSRALRIDSAMLEVQDSEAYEIPIDLITVDQFSQINIKSTSSAIPTRLYADGAYPLETLTLWPVPSVANKLVLYSWKPLSTFANANSTVALPPGYEDAIVYNLALRMAPEYGKSPDPAIVIQATETKESIKRMNIKPHYIGCDAAVLSRSSSFNWLTGE